MSDALKSLDHAAAAEMLERVRLALRQAGPTSGLHRGEAVEADTTLAIVRDLLREIAERKAARLAREQQTQDTAVLDEVRDQQEAQGGLL